MPLVSRRRFLGLVALSPLGGAGCQGTFPTVFGYRLGAGALYDPNITTVYVPQFHNRTFQTTPYRGMEREITKAVVDEIGRTTTFRVTSDADTADTELLGVLVQLDKAILNRTQQNTVREGDLVVAVDVVWRDLRDGKILSSPGKRPGAAPAVPAVPFDPNIPTAPTPAATSTPTPVQVVAIGRYIPELGETNASARDLVQRRLAVKIVEMMEKQW